MTVSHLWHSKAKYKNSITCNQNSEGREATRRCSNNWKQEAEVEERSEKHQIVDTEGAALCQNAVKRLF